ncbi:MAG: hypothetical protein J6C63_06980 [Lachnospiraceae bacterium]|nr:hypothetical protein [Lachnospiraceae bacterium]
MFSYEDYKKIIRIIKSTERYMDYHKALTSDKFILMRHDVEYSVERAYELAKVESSMDFTSTFFFQWTNNSYNILSRKNKDLIKDMHERGHTIGLHFALNGMTDMEQIRKQIAKEMDILNSMFEFKIDTFSIHRPSKDVLRENIKLPGIINAYQDEFFTFAENVTENTPVSVKYLSDANHIWRYGYPDEKNILENDKVQILTHPFAWCKQGYDNFDNYKSLIKEKYIELVNSVDNECKDFGEYKDWFMENFPV